jgi:hypothetical protein
VAERDQSLKAACPKLAYPVPRSPDAPLALLAARKMLQQEELSGRHPNPAESMLLASVGRDRAHLVFGLDEKDG